MAHSRWPITDGRHALRPLVHRLAWLPPFEGDEPMNELDSVVGRICNPPGRFEKPSYEPMTRRGFLQAGVMAAMTPGLAAAQPEAKKGKPKIGCLSWCFHDFSAGANPEPAIDIIGELGFDGIELILLARNDIKGFWTDARIDQFKKKLDKHKLQVSQFVIFQPVVQDLSSVRDDLREQSLDYFEAGCKIGKKFNAPMVNIVAPWARELSPPGGGYLPRYYDLNEPKPGEKFTIRIADGFDWDEVWNAYVKATKACLERAKTHGLKLTVEHHTHTIIPDAVSFLRLWDAIRDPALGYNLDTGWTLLQREYPPVAIYKVKKHLMNLHVRDIDGPMRRFVHVGTGVMDFKAVADTLKKINYDGFLSIEQDKYPGDMKETCKRYLQMMREYIG
jgi:sugar phosphate isomerase/epimerase